MTTDTLSNARTYWITWGILLAVTLVMLAVDSASISSAVLVTVLLTAMVLKAGLIAGTFMHLRQERPGLVVTVVVGLFVMAIVLFALMAPDALRIREMMRAGR